jgi:para-aminobenzoate synthetase component I
LTSPILSAIEEINVLSAQNIPFFFCIDYELEKPIVIPLHQINNKDIIIQTPYFSNSENIFFEAPIIAKKLPIPYPLYHAAFNHVVKEQKAGNSYLTNLTFPSEIEINTSLYQLYYAAKAKYKLYFKNQFVCFSPECFIRIENNKIYSYPMKGTIDASIKNAETIILNDEKEKAEHATIVDLIRNDISLFANHVQVNRYRFIDKIITNGKTLLQVSSEISGELDNHFEKKLGQLIFSLLPAGSISGAPKKKTIEIIQQAEKSKRGYYTGIFGIYNNKVLDSAVIIRYVEKGNEGKYYYRSGGGITALSNCENEYHELIDKIYVPIN